MSASGPTRLCSAKNNFQVRTFIWGPDLCNFYAKEITPGYTMFTLEKCLVGTFQVKGFFKSFLV